MKAKPLIICSAVVLVGVLVVFLTRAKPAPEYAFLEGAFRRGGISERHRLIVPRDFSEVTKLAEQELSASGGKMRRLNYFQSRYESDDGTIHFERGTGFRGFTATLRAGETAVVIVPGPESPLQKLRKALRL